jgi:hypothetical protein
MKPVRPPRQRSGPPGRVYPVVECHGEGGKETSRKVSGRGTRGKQSTAVWRETACARVNSGHWLQRPEASASGRPALTSALRGSVVNRAGLASTRASASSPATDCGAGTVKSKREPRPTSLSTHTRPPWASTMPFTIERPRPMPGVVPVRRLPEPAEDVRDLVRGDAGTGVGHHEAELFLERHAPDLHGAAVGGELEGVLDQVGQHLKIRMLSIDPGRRRASSTARSSIPRSSASGPPLRGGGSPESRSTSEPIAMVLSGFRRSCATMASISSRERVACWAWSNSVAFSIVMAARRASSQARTCRPRSAQRSDCRAGVARPVVHGAARRGPAARAARPGRRGGGGVPPLPRPAGQCRVGRARSR